MSKDLKAILVFTMLYGLFSLGMLSLQPHAFEADPASVVQVAWVIAD